MRVVNRINLEVAAQLGAMRSCATQEVLVQRMHVDVAGIVGELLAWQQRRATKAASDRS